MKPFSLHGHERSITQIKYNREGDLLFSCAKDHAPNVWYSLNGERLGTYNGHVGAVWCIDVNWDTTRLMSGSADESCFLWDVETGVEIGKIYAESSVRTCNFSYSANMASYSTDRRKITYPDNTSVIKDCEIVIIDVRNADSSISSQDPILRIKVDKSKVTSMLWGPLDQSLITGHEDGTIVQWDLKMGKEISSQKCHDMQINDMQMSKDQIFFITASKDTTAKLFLTDQLSVLKTYKDRRPVNSAAISPILDHVVLGGGQEAMEVTTTSTRHGKFESRFYHLIFEEEFARVKGHFGPINSLAFHPDGKSYATGGEDGYVRVQVFDQNYYDFGFDY